MIGGTLSFRGPAVWGNGMNQRRCATRFVLALLPTNMAIW